MKLISIVKIIVDSNTPNPHNLYIDKVFRFEGFIMWQDKGRSGYGDRTIGGDYDSWDGISPNGRQYKNEITQEVRNLSGYRYWDMRKQSSPEQVIPESLHMLNKNRANIEAYADPAPTKKKTSVPLIDRVLPQQRRVRVLTEQLYELEAERKAGMDIHTYSQLRDVLICKRNRAEVLYRKAISVKAPSYDDEDTAQTWEETYKVSGVYASENGDHVQGESVSWIDELSDENCFKKILQKACKAKRKLVQFSHQVKKFTQKAKAFYIRFEGV